MKRKIIALFCVMCLFVVFIGNAYATNSDDVGPLRHNYVQTATYSASKSGGTVYYYATVQCAQNATYCKATAYLQYRTIGSSTWVNVESVTASGVRECSAADSAPAVANKEYRVKAVFYASGSSGTADSFTRYSNPVS